MASRQCAFCGKHFAAHLDACPHCREVVSDTHPSGLTAQEFAVAMGGPEIRRGLLYMLMAAVFYYFAGGYSPLQFPMTFSRLMTDYFLPLLFLGGLGLFGYGLVRRFSK
jgi:hypothetical protein